ncbi:MAG: CARDB domain-containing protein [Nanoarchaeota archaeon]
MRWLLLSTILFFTACTITGNVVNEPVPFYCHESDPGKDFMTYGETCFGADCKQDYCEGRAIVEHYCKDNTIQEGHFTCPGACEHGQCTDKRYDTGAYDLHWQPQMPRPGEQVSIYYVVKNTGNIDQVASWSEICITGMGCIKESVPRLDPNEEHTHLRRITFHTSGDYDVWFRTDINDVIPEIDETNNERKDTILVRR